MAKYNSVGDRIPYTPTSGNVAAGDVVIQEDLVGIALEPILENELGTLAIEGVFELPKDDGSGTGIDAGKTVYWDDSANEVTDESSGNTRIGKAALAASDADETVMVKLIP